jgi:hypothetical protein
MKTRITIATQKNGTANVVRTEYETHDVDIPDDLYRRFNDGTVDGADILREIGPMGNPSDITLDDRIDGEANWSGEKETLFVLIRELK